MSKSIAKKKAPASKAGGAKTAAAAPKVSPSEDPTLAVPKGKLGVVVELLRRDGGARLDELMTATGWQAHSVRGVIAGAIKKKLGLKVASEKSDAGRVYSIKAVAL